MINVEFDKGHDYFDQQLNFYQIRLDKIKEKEILQRKMITSYGYSAHDKRILRGCFSELVKLKATNNGVTKVSL